MRNRCSKKCNDGEVVSDTEVRKVVPKRKTVSELSQTEINLTDSLK